MSSCVIQPASLVSSVSSSSSSSSAPISEHSHLHKLTPLWTTLRTHPRCVKTNVMGLKVELYCTEPCPAWLASPIRWRTIDGCSKNAWLVLWWVSCRKVSEQMKSSFGDNWGDWGSTCSMPHFFVGDMRRIWNMYYTAKTLLVKCIETSTGRLQSYSTCQLCKEVSVSSVCNHKTPFNTSTCHSVTFLMHESFDQSPFHAWPMTHLIEDNWIRVNNINHWAMAAPERHISMSCAENSDMSTVKLVSFSCTQYDNYGIKFYYSKFCGTIFTLLKFCPVNNIWHLLLSENCKQC